MNIQSNPWSFVPGDINNQAIVASPTGLVQDPFNRRKVTLTTTGAHGFVVGNFITVIAPTLAGYAGFYKVLVVPSGTTAILESTSQLTQGGGITALLAASGGGFAVRNQYEHTVNVADLNWQKDVTPGDTIDLRDRNGNILWQGIATASTFARGKLGWVQGLTLVQMTGGLLIVSVGK